jgi:ectoine hydroxylase-related dioxygenase (phytanoyl-CoA dioxygenase family)
MDAAALAETPTLSRAEIDLWHEQGFLGPYTLVEPEEMARLRARIDDEIFTKDQRPDWQRLHDRHLDVPEVWSLCSNPALVERVAGLIGPDLILWRTNFQLKAAGGDAVPWHQDGAYYGLEPCVLVSAWIAVDEATRENGCLQVMPGTHHAPIPHLVDSSKSAFGKEIDRGALDLAKSVAFTLRPGQFVLFNENTAHGSEANRTASRRLGLSPRITVPFVRVPPIGQGQPRPVSLLRGRDYLGLNRLLPPPG